MSKTINYIREALQAIYTKNEATFLSRIICNEILEQPLTDYYMGKDIVLSENQEKKLDSIITRLLNYEPIQYVQGTAPFLGRRFRVTPKVLIPRPETEELVEKILATMPYAESALDIGTGSGCIAITLSLSLPSAHISAWDISEEALLVAKYNNKALGANVHFSRKDVLAVSSKDCEERYDIIVSNPPYVTQKESKEMEHNVLDWEPKIALFVPDNTPLLFYEKIGVLGRILLKEGGRLFFEANRAYAKDVAVMLEEKGYNEIIISRDIFNNERFVTARK